MLRTINLSAILISTLLLVGCGGSSSSSSETTTTTTSAPTPTTSNSTECKAVGNTVLVPEGGQCTYSISSLNGGASQTYSCTNGRVSSNGLSGSSITFNNTTITCE